MSTSAVLVVNINLQRCDATLARVLAFDVPRVDGKVFVWRDRQPERPNAGKVKVGAGKRRKVTFAEYRPHWVGFGWVVHFSNGAIGARPTFSTRRARVVALPVRLAQASTCSRSADPVAVARLHSAARTSTVARWTPVTWDAVAPGAVKRVLRTKDARQVALLPDEIWVDWRFSEQRASPLARPVGDFFQDGFAPVRVPQHRCHGVLEEAADGNVVKASGVSKLRNCRAKRGTTGDDIGTAGITIKQEELLAQVNRLWLNIRHRPQIRVQDIHCETVGKHWDRKR